jgi:Dihydrouridine synthase (Dus)
MIRKLQHDARMHYVVALPSSITIPQAHRTNNCKHACAAQGGMGAALLTNPDLACEIVRTLCAGVSVPVSVKIRLLETTEQTVELAKRLEAAGAAALTVHARLRSTSPKDAAMWEQLRPIVDVSKTTNRVHDCMSSNVAHQRQAVAASGRAVIICCSCC